jgi:outer membrane protein TolC
MKTMIAIVVSLSLNLVSALAASNTVTLKVALTSAVSKARADDARSEVAASQLRLLEANNKWKVELRPSLGMFAFSNPALLAANLGAGLLMGKRNAPSPMTLASARFDLLAAELASERIRIKTEIETARAFFDLLEKQQIAAQIKQAVASRRQKLGTVEKLLNASRVTMVDKVSYEQELLELENQQIELEMQRKLAAVQLAALMGRLETADELEVEDVSVKGASFGRPLPPMEKMFESALVYRRESQLLREKIDALRLQAGMQKAVKFESVSAGYSYLANGATGLANSARAGLLGGNTGQGALNLSIPLRNTGEKQAEREVLAARIKALELETRGMEENLRAELLSMRGIVQASIDRLRLADRKVELARMKKDMVTVRAENGLGGFSATNSAEESALQAQAGLVQALCARKTSLFTLMVICGLQDQPETVQAAALGN